MRICMVGSGRMANAHSRALGDLPDVELHTVVDPDQDYAEALRERYGYRRTLPDLDEALAQEAIDAVVICTPNPLHAPQSAAALRAGKHVLCEIPLALSLADAEELAHLAEANQRCLMVCHTERFEAGRMELQRRIVAGEFHPVHVVGRYYMLRRGELKTEQARQGWVDNMLWHHGCHVVDAVMGMLGAHDALDLHAQWGPAWPSLGLPLDVDVHWRALSPITGDQVLVTMSLSHHAQWNRHDYHVIGLEDDLLADHGSLRNQEGVLAEESAGSARIVRQDAEFLAAVRKGRAPEVDMTSVLATMRVLQAAWDVWLHREQV
jgi:2-hydroxy-4-carboxymuconate semialdehyde hemiacetal dehydrogenase